MIADWWLASKPIGLNMLVFVVDIFISVGNQMNF